jgi:hypothetical protein
MDDDLTHEEYQFWQRLLFNGRGLLSAIFIAVGLTTIGVGLLKIISICVLVYLLHGFHFGSRRVEQIGLLLLLIGVASWADIIPVQAIIAHVKLQTIAALVR